MLLSNSLDISHKLVQKVVEPGDIVVDATAGNGNDTLFLAGLVGDRGKVYSFDIQGCALNNTRNRLRAAKAPDCVKLINDGHQNIDLYVPEGIKAVMFNLGYLPGGDHSIGTKPQTTIEALEKSMKLLMCGGIIMMVIYYGGDSGFEEKDAILKYVKTIDCRKYSVLICDFINQINCPPIAVCIEKIKECSKRERGDHVSGEKKDITGWAFVWNVADEKEAIMAESILKSEGIPVFRKYKEGGDYLRIYMGMSRFGIDLYVPESDLELAEGLLKSEIVDLPEDEGED